MARLRTVEGLTLREIAARYGISGARVRQLVNRHLHEATGQHVDARAISEAAAQIRRTKDLDAAHSYTTVILAARRAGEKPASIAKRLGLRHESVSEVIDSAALLAAANTVGQV